MLPAPRPGGTRAGLARPDLVRQTEWTLLTGRKSDIDIEWIRRELGVYDPEDKQFELMNMLTIGKEPPVQWLCLRALAKSDVIVYTVRQLITRSTGTGGKSWRQPGFHHCSYALPAGPNSRHATVAATFSFRAGPNS